LLTRDWSQYGIQMGGAMELRDVPRSKLEWFQLSGYLMFYLRPRKWRSLLRMVRFSAIPAYAFHLLTGLFRSGK
jgi:hypothetical protein